MSDHGVEHSMRHSPTRRAGYAEADSTADVAGYDAAAKCAILASIAFDARVTDADVFREGITHVTAQDIGNCSTSSCSGCLRHRR